MTETKVTKKKQNYLVPILVQSSSITAKCVPRGNCEGQDDGAVLKLGIGRNVDTNKIYLS